METVVGGTRQPVRVRVLRHHRCRWFAQVPHAEVVVVPAGQDGVGLVWVIVQPVHPPLVRALHTDRRLHAARVQCEQVAFTAQAECVRVMRVPAPTAIRSALNGSGGRAGFCSR
eukprot:scaffold6181_cov129-Isochrysis_galbana.AAC.9